MPLSTRANNTRQTNMPCCDLDADGVERESAMLTALFDPTEWPPLLNLMDSNSTTTQNVEKRKQVESSTQDSTWNKRPRLETVGEESPKKKRFKKRDERRRLLKISVNKLRNIDDAETFLRRSVLIHNTVRRLQNELEQERLGDPWEDEEPYGVSENVLQITVGGDGKCDPSSRQQQQQQQQSDCSGNQCAAQYRTSQGNGHQGESVFDSVVYHSLLVSLES